MSAHTGLHWGWFPRFFVFLGVLALLAFLDIRGDAAMLTGALAVGRRSALDRVFVNRGRG